MVKFLKKAGSTSNNRSWEDLYKTYSGVTQWFLYLELFIKYQPYVVFPPWTGYFSENWKGQATGVLTVLFKKALHFLFLFSSTYFLKANILAGGPSESVDNWKRYSSTGGNWPKSLNAVGWEPSRTVIFAALWRILWNFSGFEPPYLLVSSQDALYTVQILISINPLFLRQAELYKF